MKKICFVTGWYSAPYFSALGAKLQSYMDVSFIAQDSYTHQYLLQHKQKYIKELKNSFFQMLLIMLMKIQLRWMRCLHQKDLVIIIFG